MDQLDVERFISAMDNVQQEDNFGYLFFFVGDDHTLPFATIGYSDNDFDTVSNLNREGIFRLNFGVSRDTFNTYFDDASIDGFDFSVLDVFMPHPHYAKQNFMCILNPSGENVEITKKLLTEAHAIATQRHQRKQTS